MAAVLSFYFSDQVLPYYGASDPKFNTLAPNNFMYFDLMRWGGQNGYSIFDFGRSKKVKGSYDFKSHWGMMERELPYELMLIKRKQIPNYTPTNPVFQLPILCWQRCRFQSHEFWVLCWCGSCRDVHVMFGLQADSSMVERLY